jgi:hypothetical protein
MKIRPIYHQNESSGTSVYLPSVEDIDSDIPHQVDEVA